MARGSDNRELAREIGGIRRPIKAMNEGMLKTIRAGIAMCLGRTGEMVTERGMWRHRVARYVAWPEISCNVRPELDRPSHLLRQLSSSASSTSRPSLSPTTWLTSPTTCGPRRWQDNIRTSTLLASSLPTTILSLPHPTPRSNYRSPAKDSHVHTDQHFHFMLAALRSAHNEYTY